MIHATIDKNYLKKPFLQEAQIIAPARQCSNYFPAGNYIFKVSYRNTRTRCEICSKLTIKTQERRQWHGFGVFDVNFEHILQLVLVFLLINIEHVITDWARTLLIHLMPTKWP